MKLFLSTFVWLVCVSGTLNADTLFLKNGKQEEGKILGITQFSVKFQTKDGLRTFARSQIQRITYGADKKEEKKEEKKEASKEPATTASKSAPVPVRQPDAAAILKKASEQASEKKTATAPPKKPSVPAGAPGIDRSQALTVIQRSAILPGWGQRTRGEETKGWAMTGLFAGGLAYAAVAHTRQERALADYNTAFGWALFNHEYLALDVLRFHTLRQEALAWNARRNQALYFSAAVYALSLLDAAFYVKSYLSRTDGTPPAHEIGVFILSDGKERAALGAGLRLRF